MANDSTEPGAPQDQGRRRMAPTIEGTATEIAVTPITPDAPPQADAPAPDTAAQAADLADQIETPKEDIAAAEEPAAAESGPVADEPEVGGSPPGEPPAFTPVAAAAPSGSSAWRGMAAGAIAGLVVVAIAGAAAYTLRPRDQTPDILARLARAEVKVADIAGTAASQKAIDDIAARIAKIEARIADTAGATGGSADIPEARLAAAEAATRTLAERIAALDQHLAAAQKSLAGVDPAKLAALEQRVAAAEAAVKDTKAALAAVTEPPGLKAVRLAVAAQALDAAVGRGAPYAAELAAVRALGGDDAALAPFAASGLPSPAALATELTQLAPKLHAAAAPQASDTSILAKFTANAEKLVRVRPTGDVAGDDAGAVLARMETKAARGDLAGSVAEAPKLPAEARALADPWVKRVAAREAARAAAQKLFAASLAAVSTDKGPAR